MKKIVLYITVFVVTFFSVSMIMNFVNENKVLENNEEELVGDKDDYVFSFDEVTIPNQKIVAFDNTDIDYIRYYVIEFSGEQFILYNYYFLKGHTQYMEKYSELSSNIVDYNYDEFMIKTIETISYGTYNEIIDDLQDVINDNSIYLIY